MRSIKQNETALIHQSSACAIVATINFSFGFMAQWTASSTAEVPRCSVDSAHYYTTASYVMLRISRKYLRFAAIRLVILRYSSIGLMFVNTNFSQTGTFLVLLNSTPCCCFREAYKPTVEELLQQSCEFRTFKVVSFFFAVCVTRLAKNTHLSEIFVITRLEFPPRPVVKNVCPGIYLCLCVHFKIHLSLAYWSERKCSQFRLKGEQRILCSWCWMCIVPSWARDNSAHKLILLLDFHESRLQFISAEFSNRQSPVSNVFQVPIDSSLEEWNARFGKVTTVTDDYTVRHQVRNFTALS